jgi:hypothetical protein
VGLFIEPEEWDIVVRTFRCSEGEGSYHVELARSLIDLPGSLSGYIIGILVDIAPICLDREIEQLELTLGEMEEGVAESKARTARADGKAPAKVTASPGEQGKHGRKPMPPHLPRERTVHEPAPVCTGCGGTVLRKLLTFIFWLLVQPKYRETAAYSLENTGRRYELRSIDGHKRAFLTKSSNRERVCPEQGWAKADNREKDCGRCRRLPIRPALSRRRGAETGGIRVLV